jgi:hypothetical protein
MTTRSKNKKDKKLEETKTKIRTNSVEEENTEIITTMAVNGQQEKPQNKVGEKINETNNRSNNNESNGEKKEEKNKIKIQTIVKTTAIRKITMERKAKQK